MRKQLFFDDNKLFGKENVVRKYGKPQQTAVYNDGICSTDYCTGFVFPLDNGKYRLLYFGHGTEFSGHKLFAAISDDGVHFSPEEIYDLSQNTDKLYPHEIMSLPDGHEVAFIYEDKHCDNKNEKYKLIMSELTWEKFHIDDRIYVSADLINWSVKEGVLWGDGTEPLASIFYNKKEQTHTIIQRPFWGIRSVGYKETKDFKSFTEFRYCLNVDALDEHLAEIYGMYAFEYDDMYIGLPHMYRKLKNEYNAKYSNGIIDTQLAYSYDGRYWQRSLREPFLSGVENEAETKHNLLWVFNMLRREDGSITFYASGSEHEHGPAFRRPGTGKIFVYSLRNDGFISLCSENKEAPSTVITREKVWQGGEAHLNIKARGATLAVRYSDETICVEGNALGHTRPIEGYGHDDCIPFSGDSTDWVPEYRSGKKLDDLAGKTLVFELKFTDGEVFSFSGDYTDVFNTQAVRYRKFGVLPR